MNRQPSETLYVCDCGYAGERHGHATVGGRVCPLWSQMRQFVPTASIVPRLQWIRGMCSDEEPHHLIDAKIVEAIDAATDCTCAGRITAHPSGHLLDCPKRAEGARAA